MELVKDRMVVQYATVSALTVQVCEYIFYLPDEISYFWDKRTSITKVVYLWSRYFPLIAQMINVVLSSRTSATFPHSPKACATEYAFKSILGQLTLEGIEVVLMVRLYALYNCSKRIGKFLVFIFILCTSLHTYANFLSVKNLTSVPSCTPQKTSRETLALFSISAGISQSVILLMTLGKYVFGVRNGWARSPLVSLMLRDGLFIYLLSFVIVATLVTLEGLRNISDQALGAIFGWYVATMSIVGCRLVVRVRRLAGERLRLDSETDMSLSSIHEIFGDPSRASSRSNPTTVESAMNTDESYTLGSSDATLPPSISTSRTTLDLSPSLNDVHSDSHLDRRDLTPSTQC